MLRLKNLRLRISVYFCTISFIMVIYYGILPSMISTVFPYHYNISYLTDELKLLQPTEKKTYTTCPDNVVNHALIRLSEVNLTDAEINQTKSKWQSFVVSVPPYPVNEYSGRGIVTSASSEFHRYDRLIALIKLLRWLKCLLPIEVYAYSEELKTIEITEFEKIPNVKVRVLKDSVTPAAQKLNRFLIKLVAILNSSFEHVLWLDADNIAVRNPEYLFDLPHYTRSTAIFWPDFWSTPGKNAIWKILGIPCRAEDYEQESGQLLINKRLSWKALNLALYFNSDPVISKVIYGDKDAYRLSWKVLGTSFYFIRKFLGIGGFYYVKSDKKSKLNKKAKFCGHTMVQHDPFGEILFLHTNLVKYFPLIDFPIEKNHVPLRNYTNIWRVYRRYANSAPYFRPRIFQEGSFLCTTFPSASIDNPIPLFEDDFHSQVSAKITAQYLSYLNGSVIRSPNHYGIHVFDRN